MTWPKSLGLCLLVATVAGCGASGRASVPVESGPDQASVRGEQTPGAEAAKASSDAAATLPEADVTALTGVRVVPAADPAGSVKVEIAASAPVNYTSYQPEPNSFILEIPNVDLSKLPADVPMAGAGWNPIKISGLPS
ncbi:MAG TPA: hypothetical protein VE404_03465, partial [Verrucomicrobiae bacterium]|nr:hypothetical protein [Verrucomicrobiae bacterium]